MENNFITQNIIMFKQNNYMKAILSKNKFYISLLDYKFDHIVFTYNIPKQNGIGYKVLFQADVSHVHMSDNKDIISFSANGSELIIQGDFDVEQYISPNYLEVYYLLKLTETEEIIMLHCCFL